MSSPESPASATTGSTCRHGRCHGHGRRALLVLAGLGLAGALAFGASRAVGQGPHTGGLAFLHHTCSVEDAEKHVTRMVGWLVDDLKGTPEQEAKLVEIAKGALVDLAPLHVEAKANRAQIVAVLAAPTIDRAALESLRARQVALMTSASTRLTKVVADAAEVLTPAQRTALAEKITKRFG